MYDGHGFELKDHERLVALAKDASAPGATVAICNHDTDEARNLYVCSEIVAIQVARCISASGARRTPAAEIITVFRPDLQACVADPVRDAESELG